MTATRPPDPASPGPPAEGDTVNIAGQLTQMAARTPEKRAVVWTAGRDRSGRPRYADITFRDLEEDPEGDLSCR